MATMQEIRKTWWRRFKVFFISILLIALAVLAFLIFGTYSSGTRTGYVTKVSNKGVLFKTWEGELNFGFFGGAGSDGKEASTVWYFSVANDDVAKEVAEASESAKKVTLHYREKYVQLSFRGDTKYMVYKVETIEE